MRFRKVPFREYGWMVLLGIASMAEGAVVLATVGHVHTGLPLVVARALSKSRLKWQ